MAAIAIAVLTLAGIAAVLGVVLGFAASRLPAGRDTIAERIDAALPQTQCAQCGYTGCRPYAEAIAAGEADIDQCPPGGETLVRTLADLLGSEAKPADRAFSAPQSQTTAVIGEAACLGCTLCIAACPVDAIVGAHRQMHTVLPNVCTGCELCVAPCPVDCIDMVPVVETLASWKYPLPGAVAGGH